MLSNHTAWLTALQLSGWRKTPPIWWLAKFMSSSKVFKTWGKLSVAVKYHGLGNFQPQERIILQRAINNQFTLGKALVREVEIFVDTKSMMVARTVVPWHDCQQIWHATNTTGNKPIGQSLFADFKVSRTPFVFANLAVPFAFHRHGELLTELPKHWVRRSLFLKYHRPMLLTEWFLPDFMARMPTTRQQQQQIVQLSSRK